MQYVIVIYDGNCMLPHRYYVSMGTNRGTYPHLCQRFVVFFFCTVVKILWDGRIRNVLAFKSLQIYVGILTTYLNILLLQTCPIFDGSFNASIWDFRRVFLSLDVPGKIFSNVFVRSLRSFSARVACALDCLVSARLLLLCVLSFVYLKSPYMHYLGPWLFPPVSDFQICLLILFIGTSLIWLHRTRPPHVCIPCTFGNWSGHLWHIHHPHDSLFPGVKVIPLFPKKY